jgi:hypothetical protein
MKSWQRQIRDKEAAQSPRKTVGLATAEVREISYEAAKSVILKYQWLCSMGTTEQAYGLYLRGELAGVVCFGKTAGTRTLASVCGQRWAKHATVLCRGACVHWAHKHSASHLISTACNLMAQKGTHIFVAYSDTEAGEIGTVHQACNWIYCGETAGTTMYQTSDGKVRDTKLIHSCTRSRKNRSQFPDDTGRRFFEVNRTKYYAGETLPDGRVVRGSSTYPYIQEQTRREKVVTLKQAGAKFFKGNPKHRYVGIYADKRTRRQILKALRWQSAPYPKRLTNESKVTPTAQAAHAERVSRGASKISGSAEVH